MASSFNDSYVARRVMAIIVSLLTLSCAPPASVLDGDAAPSRDAISTTRAKQPRATRSG